ncbi:hypothetical protein NG796_04405 [Laspinema sp. A4]|uniref:hypothetical protein n=1 Tax=Laspinema sp. D2d TaxID=2953686 RepID=UPI0021BA86CB|nr:hypothetical protein [Laspinema sp. D2d]MCT7982529.1 hypothetical protein [Laspinema sp. D2d]
MTLPEIWFGSRLTPSKSCQITSAGHGDLSRDRRGKSSLNGGNALEWFGSDRAWK